MCSATTALQPKSVQFGGSFVNRVKTTAALASAVSKPATLSVVLEQCLRALCCFGRTAQCRKLMHGLQSLLSVTLLFEPLRCSIFLFLQAVDLGLIWCERLDGPDAFYFCNLHNNLLVCIYPDVKTKGLWVQVRRSPKQDRQRRKVIVGSAGLRFRYGLDDHLTHCPAVCVYVLHPAGHCLGDHHQCPIKCLAGCV